MHRDNETNIPTLSGLLQVDVRADAKTEVLRLLTCAHSLERYLKLPSTTRCNGFRLIAAPGTCESLTCLCRTNQDTASFEQIKTQRLSFARWYLASDNAAVEKIPQARCDGGYLG